MGCDRGYFTATRIAQAKPNDDSHHWSTNGAYTTWRKGLNAGLSGQKPNSHHSHPFWLGQCNSPPPPWLRYDQNLCTLNPHGAATKSSTTDPSLTLCGQAWWFSHINHATAEATKTNVTKPSLIPLNQNLDLKRQEKLLTSICHCVFFSHLPHHVCIRRLSIICLAHHQHMRICNANQLKLGDFQNTQSVTISEVVRSSPTWLLPRTSGDGSNKYQWTHQIRQFFGQVRSAMSAFAA